MDSTQKSPRLEPSSMRSDCEPVAPKAEDKNKYLSDIRVFEYDSIHLEKVAALFRAGMMDNMEQAVDQFSRERVPRFVEEASAQLEDIGQLLHEENGGKLFVAATTSDDIVGIFGVSRSLEDAENQAVEFTRISVAKSRRQCGLCRLMLAHAEKYARCEFGAKQAYLFTLSSFTYVMKAYEKLGFQQGPTNELDEHGLDVATALPLIVKFSKDI